MSDPHHYCIARKDLSLGVLSAQLIHAAGESNPGGLHSFAVALYAKDEAHLLSLEKRLQEACVAHVAVRETDSPYDGQIVAIGINPCIRADCKPLRQAVAGLKLIKEMDK